MRGSIIVTAAARPVLRTAILAGMRRVFPLVAAVAFGACSPAAPRRAEPAAPPPAAEFLLAAGDSTYWVTSGAAGARVRGAPLTLARYGGRFYEVYVGDDDRSFYDAVFVGQRIFRRDLLAGDSLQVYVDSGVAAAARRYGAAHTD